MRKATPAWQYGSRLKQRAVPTCFFLVLIIASRCLAQTSGTPAGIEDEAHFTVGGVDSHGSVGGKRNDDATGPSALTAWLGLPVREITFEGVSVDRLKPLPGKLPQAVGSPLDRLKVAASLRALFATGLFDTVEADATRRDDGVKLVFKGTARQFIGTVSVDGAKGATINAQLQAASRLTAGTRFTQARLDAAMVRMRQALADNGFPEPVITYKLTKHTGEQLVDIAFEVVSGVQSRVGAVAVSGDSGLSVEQFRHHARLRDGAKVDHDTSNRALSGVLKYYQKQDRLEADVKLEEQAYSAATKRSNFKFSANRGPVVKLSVDGAKLGEDRLKRLVPVFEEGTVDEDLLNEGNRRLRDYFQRQGYFDVKVDHNEQSPEGQPVTITYKVTLERAGRWRRSRLQEIVISTRRRWKNC